MAQETKGIWQSRKGKQQAQFELDDVSCDKITICDPDRAPSHVQFELDNVSYDTITRCDQDPAPLHAQFELDNALQDTIDPDLALSHGELGPNPRIYRYSLSQAIFRIFTHIFMCGLTCLLAFICTQVRKTYFLKLRFHADSYL